MENVKNTDRQSSKNERNMIKQALKIMWRKRGQNGFLLFEMILSFLILFGVFSLVTFQLRKYYQPLGFESENVATAFIEFGDLRKEYGYTDKEGYDTLKFMHHLDQLKREVLQIDGINDASYSINVLPFNNSTWGVGNQTDAEGVISYEHSYLIFADEDYGNVLRPKLSQGRLFTKEDKVAKYPPILVNELFVEKYAKDNEKVLGKKIQIWGKLYDVVGVMSNFKFRGEFFDETPVILPLMQQSDIINTLLVTFDNTANPSWEYEFQQVLEKSLKGVSFFHFKLEDTRIRSSRRKWVMIYGLLALGLFLVINVAMGIFGMLQYTIKKRRGEIGLRKALGAKHGDIRRQFLIEMLILTSIAVVVGSFLSIQVPLLDLFEWENSTFYYAIIFTILFIYAVVIICSLIPSIQASKIQPAIALHENG